MPPPPEPSEIDFDDLDADDKQTEFPPRYARRRGQPFSGVVVLREDDVETRCDYVAGRPHGAYRAIAESGQVLEEAEYVEGAPVGESREWWPNGALRGSIRYSEHGRAELRRAYDEPGQLRYEWTPTRHRTWYADGVLRTDSAGGLQRVYVRDGRCAYSEDHNPGVKFQDAFTFDDDVLSEAVWELLQELELDRGVWMWLHRRLDQGDANAIELLRRILTGSNLSACVTATQLVAHRKLQPLRPELVALQRDPRLTPKRHGEYPGQCTQGGGSSLAAAARLSLAKLDG